LSRGGRFAAEFIKKEHRTQETEGKMNIQYPTRNKECPRKEASYGKLFADLLVADIMGAADLNKG
jgi:hypothetical protein